MSLREMEDPFEEIHDVRRKIAKEFDDDPWKYGEYLRQLQSTPELRGRLYDPPRPGQKESAA